MKPTKNLLATCAIAALSTAASHAAIIFNDTFEDGAGVGETATAGNDAFDPNDIAWAGENSTVMSVQTDATFGSQVLQALRSGGGDTFNLTRGTFTTQTLSSIGDSITLSLDFRIYNNQGADNAAAVRFGLGDGSQTMGLLMGNTATATASDNPRFTYYPNPEPQGSGGVGQTTTGTNTSAVSINDNAVHSLAMTITRSSTGLGLSADLDGDTYTASYATGSFFSFSDVTLATGSTGDDLRFDNIQVEFSPVPEPSTALLGALGALALLRRRR